MQCRRVQKCNVVTCGLCRIVVECGSEFGCGSAEECVVGCGWSVVECGIELRCGRKGKVWE